MTTTAIVLDSNMEPLSGDMEIKRDDFSAAEQFAAESAANGTKCCIQWARSDDGQTAYWGPAGAVFKPHWYVRMGRPELAPEERSKPHTIWMTDAEWAKVQAAPKGWVRGLVQRERAALVCDDEARIRSEDAAIRRYVWRQRLLAGDA